MLNQCLFKYSDTVQFQKPPQMSQFSIVISKDSAMSCAFEISVRGERAVSGRMSPIAT